MATPAVDAEITPASNAPKARDDSNSPEPTGAMRSGPTLMTSHASTLRTKAASTYDAFLLPGNFVAAFPHNHEKPAYRRMLDTLEGKRLYYDVMKWTSIATLSGCPATVAPVGRTRGSLPVGLQIMGP